MVKWCEKISKEELRSFLEKHGKLVSTNISREKPSSPENLDTEKVSKFYFENEIFEVVTQFSYIFHPGDGYMRPGGHSEKDGNVISINVL